MARLMIHRQVLRMFHKLPQKVQKRVSELTTEFERDPFSPDIGLHPLKETMVDPKVRGLKKLPDGYRAIVVAPEKGDTYLLMHVAAHDEAYEWARNKRFEVHEKTGVFQVFDVQEVKEASGSSASPSRRGASYALSALSDDDLFAAGVPRPLIPAVRSVVSDDALASLAEYLPPDCRDVLFGLAAGMTLDEALEQMLGASASDAGAVVPEGPGDFSKIQEAPNFDLVFVESEDALKKVLAAKLEEWRVFLHPCQRKLVEWVTRGPLNIAGSAGTGKTVALMHRAVRLARAIQAAGDRILVTTFTANLSVTIKHLMKRLAPEVGDRIEVTNLLTLARTICGRAGWRGRIVDEEDIEHIWDEVWLDPTPSSLPLTKEELRREFELVIDPNGIDDEEAYLSTARTGRPRISREQRRAAWPVFRSFLRGCKKRNLLTFDGAIHQARLAAEQGRFPTYRHVLVDEAQDFSLEALRLVRTISPIGEDKTDPLCTVGDGHQRIYRTRTPLSRAGIEIRGRSRQLKVNYRTSEQIRRFAQGILKGVEIDDLDEGVASTSGDHSVFNGPEPDVQACGDEKAEAGAVLAWIQELLKGQKYVSHEICVTPYKPSIRAALTAAGITTYELKPHEEDPGSNEPGVRLGAMKRIKGLEFRAVAMACADASDPMNHLADSDLRARCERYVAATRARERLLVTVHE